MSERLHYSFTHNGGAIPDDSPLTQESTGMNTSTTTEKISPALVATQAGIRAAAKSGDNTFDRYTYAKLEDFFAAAKGELAANGLAIVISSQCVQHLESRQTKSGGQEYVAQVTIVGRLIHTSGEWIEVYGHGLGQDRADKAIYKAFTGAKKYLLAGLLAIPTTDDPEADEQVGIGSAKDITFKREKADKPQVEVNTQLVAAGKDPVHSVDEKKAASESYTKLAKLDPKQAGDIKRNHGTSYGPMKTALDLAYRIIIESASKAP